MYFQGLHLYNYLDEPVEGHPADERVGEELEDGEAGEDDPVHQPLRVVRLRARLQSLDGPARKRNISKFYGSFPHSYGQGQTYMLSLFLATSGELGDNSILALFSFASASHI